MRQFGALAVLALVALVAVGLLALRQQRPPVVVSPTPAATASPTPTVAVASPTPSPRPSPTPTASPSPTPSAPPRAFLQPLRMEGATQPTTLSTTLAEIAPGTARFTIAFATAQAGTPAFAVQPLPQSHLPGSTSELEIDVTNASDPSSAEQPVRVGPVRALAFGSFQGKVYRLGLDGFPLWRALVLSSPTRIVIDVGAPPGGVSADGNTAVYAPARDGTVARAFHLSGAARAFEATYLWRVKDPSGKVLAGAPGVASIGTSALWGTIETDVTLPAGASGAVTLEVYQVSPKDGSEMSSVTIPLQVR